MNRSESIKELAAAFVVAHAAIEGAVKDKTNPHFRSKYADLGNVVDAIKPHLSSNGLAFVQVPHESTESANVETILLHKSGEWLSLGVVTVPVSKADAQGYGSALTYARRYGLMSGFGVAPEDDDVNAAAKAAPARPSKVESIPSPEQQSITMDWVAAIEACDSMEDLQETFGKAWKAVHPYGRPALDNLLTAAKDARKNALAERAAA